MNKDMLLIPADMGFTALEPDKSGQIKGFYRKECFLLILEQEKEGYSASLIPELMNFTGTKSTGTYIRAVIIASIIELNRTLNELLVLIKLEMQRLQNVTESENVWYNYALIGNPNVSRNPLIITVQVPMGNLVFDATSVTWLGTRCDGYKAESAIVERTLALYSQVYEQLHERHKQLQKLFPIFTAQFSITDLS